jgi:hypothetical protein
MSKHRRTRQGIRPVATAALWVGGFLLLGILIVLIALAPDEPDPLDQPDYVTGTPQTYEQRLAEVVQRRVDAGNTSREMERVSTLPSRHQQLVERRQAARLEERRQEARRAARQADREEVTDVVVPAPTSTGGSGTPSSGGGNLPALLQLIRSNESGGNYAAYNGSGCEGYGCYGAYQMHGAYMDDWARRYGAGEWASTPANQWPPAVQDQVALGLFYSTNPDGAHWCDWTYYC